MEMLITIFERYCKDILKTPPHEWFGVSQTAWSTYKKNGIPEKHLLKIYKQFGLWVEVDEFVRQPDKLVAKVIVMDYFERRYL